LYFKKKPLKPVKLISFSHGPLHSKKLDALPEILPPNEKIVVDKKVFWKSKYEEKQDQVECALWSDFTRLYSKQVTRIELKQEQMKRERERAEREVQIKQSERERVGSVYSNV
jgi:hypothetical protein